MKPWRFAWTLISCGLLLVTSGCTLFPIAQPPPGKTDIGPSTVTLPTRLIGNYLVVETQWDKDGPYHFLIDTGSSATYMTPEVVDRHALSKHRDTTRVRSSIGTIISLPSARVGHLKLGQASFENIRVLVYDCAAISAHLGIKIDGILGFPLFDQTRLTLDYPNARVLLETPGSSAGIPGSPVRYSNQWGIPHIPIKLGGHTTQALVDSGSDTLLSLGRDDWGVQFATPPRPGAYMSSLAGDKLLEIARLRSTLEIGHYIFPGAIVYLQDDLTAIGARILRNFSLTFDPVQQQIYFLRDSYLPITTPPKRTTGLAFEKTPAYWKIVSVLPQSPAAKNDFSTGDLVTRINGEPVSEWNLSRYDTLVQAGGSISYTLLVGNTETTHTLPVIDLVP